MPGHLRWPLIERYVDHVAPAVVPGHLYDTGHDFPAAAFGDDQEDAGVIDGYLVRFAERHRVRAWEAVDAIEGDLYEQVAVVTVDGVEATAYAWAGPTVDLIPIGRRWTGV